MASTTTSAATDPTLGTISGTLVLFYPAPTPWPSVSGCGEYVWRQTDQGSMYGWDPNYWNLVGTGAEDCFQPQQSSWWFQTAEASPSTALGPTFVCPESFSAVHSTTFAGGDPATRTEFTYCCPPEYTLSTLPPFTARTAAQCISTVAPGRTLSLVTATYPGVSSGEAPTPGEPFGYLPTSTVVGGSAAATVYAAPVNGFNLVAAASAGVVVMDTGGSGGGGGGLSLGATVGIAAGASLVGVGAVFVGVWLVWRRWRRRRMVRRGAGRVALSTVGEAGEAGVWSSASELPEKSEVVEMALGVGAVEMPLGRDVYELPDHRAQAYEMPQERQESVTRGEGLEGRRESRSIDGGRRESRTERDGRESTVGGGRTESRMSEVGSRESRDVEGMRRASTSGEECREPTAEGSRRETKNEVGRRPSRAEDGRSASLSEEDRESAVLGLGEGDITVVKATDRSGG